MIKGDEKMMFIEKQKFTQWWAWVIILGLFAFPVYIYFYKGATEALVPFLWICACNLLFFLFKLTTNIDAKNIKMSWFPFVWKTVPWTEVKSVKVFDYGFVGGWGVRLWTKYGTVFNIKGSKGLHVTLNDGKTFVIGTQKAEELKECLKEIGKISE